MQHHRSPHQQGHWPRVPSLVLMTVAVAAAAAVAGCLGGEDAAPAPGPTGPVPVSVTCVAPCGVPIDAGLRWETSVGVDPTDPDHIVASSHELVRDPATDRFGYWPSAHVSFDGGLTWASVRIPGGPTASPDHPLFPYTNMEDSVVTFLHDGTVLWSALVYNVDPTETVPAITGGSVVTLRSTDGGLTYGDVAIVYEGSGLQGPTGAFGQDLGGSRYLLDFQDKQWVAVGPDGTLLMAWSRNRGGHPGCPDPSPDEECTQLLFSTSTDDGRSWSEAGLILEGGLYSGAFPLIRQDLGWVVSFRDTITREVVVAVSTDEGAEWSFARIDLTTKFPMLAPTRGPSGERIHMVYPASDDGDHDGPQNVTLRWSDDGGLTWGQPLELDASEHDGRTIPAIAASPNGTVHVTYWHALEEGGELRAVAFKDGHLSDPIVLATTDGPLSDTGDYMGLAPMADGQAFAVWNAWKDDETVVAGARLSAT